jgi:hypothetical protein
VPTALDIIEDVEVTPPVAETATPLEAEQVPRFADVWMDNMLQQQFFQAYSSTLKRLVWETKVTKVKQSSTTPTDLARRCRSFEWYAKEINPNLSKIFEKHGWEHDHEKEIAGTRDASKRSEQVVQLKPPHDVERNDEQEHKDPPPLDAIPDLVQRDKKKPSKPLRGENLKIVEQANPMDARRSQGSSSKTVFGIISTTQL